LLLHHARVMFGSSAAFPTTTNYGQAKAHFGGRKYNKGPNIGKQL